MEPLDDAQTGTKSFLAKLLVYYWSVGSTMTIPTTSSSPMSSTAGHGTDTGGSHEPGYLLRGPSVHTSAGGPFP
eukprot:3285877-Rhodomonas_salina.1